MTKKEKPVAVVEGAETAAALAAQTGAAAATLPPENPPPAAPAASEGGETETAAALAAQTGEAAATLPPEIPPTAVAPPASGGGDTETDAAPSAQTGNPPPSNEGDEDGGEPWGWQDLPAFSARDAATAAAFTTFGASVQFVQFFGVDGVFPDRYDVFVSAPEEIRERMVQYVQERRPSAETLFIKLQEWAGDERFTFDQLLPFQRAGLELVVRLVPAVLDTLEEINAEARRRQPPPEPPPPVVLPIEDTILEEVPGFGERMGN